MLHKYKQLASISLLIVVAKVSGLFKDLSVAYYFGVSKDTDSFFLAMFMSSLIYTAVYASISLVVIPKYSGFTKRLYSISQLFSVFYFILMVACFFSICTYFFSDALVLLFSSSDDLVFNSLAANYLKIMALTFPLSAGVAIFNSIQSVRGKTEIVYITPVLNNILFCASIFIFHKTYGIIAAVVAGVLSWFLVLLLNLYKEKVNFKKLFIRYGKIKFKYINLSVFGLSFLFVLLEQVNNYVPIYLTTMGNSGDLTIYTYASKLNLVILSVTLMLTTTHIMPRLSVCSSDEELKILLFKFFNLILFAALPITILVGFFSIEIVKLAFLRGNFNTDNLTSVAMLFAVLVITLPMLIMKDILNRAYFSRSKHSKCICIAVLFLILNSVTSLFLFLQYGLLGLAIALVISTSLHLSTLIFYMFNNYHFSFTYLMIKIFLKRFSFAAIPVPILYFGHYRFEALIFLYLLTYFVLMHLCKEPILNNFYKRIF